MEATTTVLKKSSKREHTSVGNPDWHPQINMTATSEYNQDSGRGRNTIANARKKEEGWNTADFSSDPAATKMLEEYPELREQIEACTTSLCMIADINHAQYKELRGTNYEGSYW